ncbi:MAG: plasmid partition protein ParG [Gloeotrichia echinulata HAB0833]
MHISISGNLKKRFHAACALRGLKMSQVVTGLIEQWLKTNEASYSDMDKSVVSRDKAAS